MQELPKPTKAKGNKREFGLKYPCDNVVTTLILNNVGSYDDIMEMSFESAIKTYASFYIQSVEFELNKELNKDG